MPLEIDPARKSHGMPRDLNCQFLGLSNNTLGLTKPSTKPLAFFINAMAAQTNIITDIFKSIVPCFIRSKAAFVAGS